MRVASRTGPRPNGIVKSVVPGSIAETVGVEAGDEILAINDVAASDILDFRFHESEEICNLDFKKPDGRMESVSIEKDPAEPLGVQFGEDLFDGIRTCRNNCPFCFVYQNPRRMRRTLYIKDEDYRYSFLHGNYMTLSNLSEEDWDKIFTMRLTPLYVSIHSTDPATRKKLLGTKQERPIMEHLVRMTEGEIDFYGQIVCIPGWNDGPDLDRTLQDLLPLHPHFQGLALVPVGLTRHREKLVDLPSYDTAAASRMIDHAEELGRQLHDRFGSRMLYLADEFYLIAGRPVPPMSYYDGYLLREDGVGMIRKFTDEFLELLPEFREQGFEGPPPPTVIATGRAASGMFSETVLPALEKLEGLDVELATIPNQFYGDSITVAGLLTATDYRAALKGKLRGRRLLIPSSSLRDDGAVFLDDATPAGLAEELETEIVAVSDSAEELLRVLRGEAPASSTFQDSPSPGIAVYGS